LVTKVNKNGGKVKVYFTFERIAAVQSINCSFTFVFVKVWYWSACIYICYLFDFFLFFSCGEEREKIWHWDKAGFRFAN